MLSGALTHRWKRFVRKYYSDSVVDVSKLTPIIILRRNKKPRPAKWLIGVFYCTGRECISSVVHPPLVARNLEIQFLASLNSRRRSIRSTRAVNWSMRVWPSTTSPYM